MTQTLRQFIEDRLADLEKEEAPLRAQMDELQAQINRIENERSEIVMALNAIEGKPLRDPHVTRRSPPELTIKKAVLVVLEDAPEGLTALQILDRINGLMNSNYPRTSLSPQLTRLKSDGFISLNGDNVWTLARQGTFRASSNDELFG